MVRQMTFVLLFLTGFISTPLWARYGINRDFREKNMYSREVDRVVERTGNSINFHTTKLSLAKRKAVYNAETHARRACEEYGGVPTTTVWRKTYGCRGFKELNYVCSAMVGVNCAL